MNKHVIIFVNGVGVRPGEAGNWNGRAVSHCIGELGIFAEKVEYYVNPLLRPMGEAERAHKLQRTVEYYLSKGFTISIAAHSNGADVALDALKAMGWPQIKSLHLVAPACVANWNDNGLNVGWVSFERIVVYIGGEDMAMEAAETVMGRLLGYGSLGKTGPIEPSGPVEVVRYPDYGHSTWFDPEHFADTMRMLTA